MSSSDRDVSDSLRAFREVLEASPARAARLLKEVHPADAAEWLLDVETDDRHRVFAELDAAYQADVLQHADELLTSQLVLRLDAGSLGELIEELPSDDAADVLEEADDRIAADALGRVEPETARELRELLAYDPESAGGVMATEFVTASVGQRVGDVVKELRKEGDDAEPDLGVFVLDAEGRPVGYLADRDLLTTKIHTPVDEVMVSPFLVTVDEDQEEVAQLIAKYGLESIAVVDAGGVLIGVISDEDAADILEEEVDEDFARLVGAGSEGLQTRLPILARVRQRLPLMGLTVLAGLASAKILAVLGTGDSHGDGAILRYLPLIVGLAGNVGIQSSTIFVRGFATGEVERDRERAVLFSEWVVGSIIGLACGLVTWLFAGSLEASGPVGIGRAVGVAVSVAVTWAAFLGGFVPVVCRRLGIDPAIVAGPFLIALSDVSGSAIYIVVANQLLERAP